MQDERLYPYLSNLGDLENLWIEPSACAAFPGPELVTNNLECHGHQDYNPTHIIWATGGSAVPEDVMKEYYKKGKN